MPLHELMTRQRAHRPAAPASHPDRRPCPRRPTRSLPVHVARPPSPSSHYPANHHTEPLNALRRSRERARVRRPALRLRRPAMRPVSSIIEGTHLCWLTHRNSNGRVWRVRTLCSFDTILSSTANASQWNALRPGTGTPDAPCGDVFRLFSILFAVYLLGVVLVALACTPMLEPIEALVLWLATTFAVLIFMCRPPPLRS